MLILAINTATINTQIALLEVGAAGRLAAHPGVPPTPVVAAAATKTARRVIWEKEWKSNYNEAEKILPAIKTALKKAEKLSAACASGAAMPGTELIPGMVFVVNGPGSFTGLRIGITVANCLAWAAGAGMEACTTFEYLRAAAPPAARARTAVMLRAGGDFVAVAGPAAASHAPAHEIILISVLPEYFKKNKAIKYILADLKPEEKKKIKLPAGVKWMPQTLLGSFGKTVAELLAAAPAAWPPAAPQNTIKPFYLQPPKITQSKKPKF